MSLLIRLGVDFKDLDSGLNKAEKDAGTHGSNIGSSLKKGLGIGLAAMGTMAVAAFAGVGAALMSTIGPASDLNETVSKTEAVFGDWTEDIIHFGEGAASGLGMSQNAAMSAAATYGNLFRSMGMGVEQSADMSMGLVTLAGDLASFNNMAPEEVLEKLRAGLTGETEPLKSLGVNT